MNNLLYLYIAGVVFWLGLWIATGWLLLRVKHLEKKMSQFLQDDDSESAS